MLSCQSASADLQYVRVQLGTHHHVVPKATAAFYAFSIINSNLVGEIFGCLGFVRQPLIRYSCQIRLNELDGSLTKIRKYPVFLPLKLDYSCVQFWWSCSFPLGRRTGSFHRNKRLDLGSVVAQEMKV